LVERLPGNITEELAGRLDAGDRHEVLRLVMEEAGGVPDIEQLPWWPEEAPFDRADTVVRENYAVEGFDVPAEPDIEAPVLLLTGEYGPEHL
jgi:hypothetical protein